MRTMARAAVLLLVVAFMAGVWDARNEDERRPARSTAPFRTDPVERSRRSRQAPELVSVQTAEREGYDRVLFTFEGSMPGLPGPLRGSGRGRRRRAAALRGQAFVAVAFEPARA